MGGRKRWSNEPFRTCVVGSGDAVASFDIVPLLGLTVKQRKGDHGIGRWRTLLNSVLSDFGEPW